MSLVLNDPESHPYTKTKYFFDDLEKGFTNTVKCEGWLQTRCRNGFQKKKTLF